MKSLLKSSGSLRLKLPQILKEAQSIIPQIPCSTFNQTRVWEIPLHFQSVVSASTIFKYFTNKKMREKRYTKKWGSVTASIKFSYLMWSSKWPRHFFSSFITARSSLAFFFLAQFSQQTILKVMFVHIST
jgi:hypothetical protein